jgi:uncharacterized membrane protein
MSDQDQDRAQGAGESSPSTETGSPSGARTNEDGQSGATAVKDTAGKAKEALKTAAQDPSTDFKTVLRDAQRIVADEVKAGLTQVATETVAPAARQAATSALISATTKAPGLLENAVKTTLAPKLKEAGGAKAIAGTVLSKFPGVITKVPGALSKLPAAGGLGSMLGKVGGGGGGGGGGGDDLKGTGRGRRLPMQAAIDVSVPVEVAYDQWTQFEDFPKFMFRVERIEQKDDTHLIWHEKIWGIRRQWEAEIVEQRPNERIVWRSTSGPQNVGVINFHRKHDPRLSRVQVNLDFQPTGLIEKTGRGWRAAIRALDTDLQRFKAYVEMKDAATGAWRGRIKDAEVQDEQDVQESSEGQPSQGEQADAEAPPEGDRQPEGEQPQPQAAETESSASREPEPSGDGGPPSAQESDEEEAGDPVVSKRRGRKG